MAGPHSTDLLTRIRDEGRRSSSSGRGPVCRMIGRGARASRFRELVYSSRTSPGADAGYASDVRAAVRKQGRLPRSPWGR